MSLSTLAHPSPNKRTHLLHTARNTSQVAIPGQNDKRSVRSPLLDAPSFLLGREVVLARNTGFVRRTTACVRFPLLRDVRQRRRAAVVFVREAQDEV